MSFLGFTDSSTTCEGSSNVLDNTSLLTFVTIGVNTRDATIYRFITQQSHTSKSFVL